MSDANEIRPLGSVVKVRRGASPRPIGDPKYFGGEVGWVRISDVTQRNYKYLRQTEQYLSPLGESLSVRVNKGDLIMSICATVGKPIIVDMDACIHDGFVQLYDNKNADIEYLFYLLQYHEKDFEKRGQPGTQVNLNTTIVEREEVFIPENKKEQQKIAKILTTVDNLIEKTEALIEKYQAIKQGMMHDLFTRGIDTNGQLRPSHHDAPHLYKQTELGWIPKEWDVVKLRDNMSIKHGYAFKGEFFFDTSPGDVLLVPGNFHRNGALYFTENNTKYYRGPVDQEYVLSNGDLLVVMTDLSPRTLILGRFVWLNVPFTALHNQRIGKVILKYDYDWDERYLLPALNNERLRLEIILTATGTTVRHSSPERILNNLICRPDIAEQQRIGELVRKQESIINKELTYKMKLEIIKKGLMQDLLTGIVRVN